MYEILIRCKIGSNTVLGFFHAFVTLMPVGRTHFTVFFMKLQCVDYPESFLNTSAYRHVIDKLVADNSLFVN